MTTAQEPVTAPRGPELIFGLVAAIGTDLDLVTRLLTEALEEVSYRVEVVRLSSLLKEIPKYASLRDTPLETRYEDYMSAGTDLRETSGRGDALAILGVQEIRARRVSATKGDPDEPASRTAYIIHSLKHPDEVKALRRIYGSGFFLVAAYSPREQRLKRLEKKIADSHHAYPPTEDHARFADSLIRRDEKEREQPRGQNVRDTFPMADVFVDASRAEHETRANIARFISLIFGNPFGWPTHEESGMYHASAAALRSLEFGRQVGAAITTAEGELIVVGANEVPKAGGGQYWPQRFDDEDHREFTRDEDSSDRLKLNSLAEVLRMLREGELLSSYANGLPFEELLNKCRPLMASTRLMNSIEYGRAVHAEMAAITEAARRGVSIDRSTLYTTTFPCHNCARHIVASGIEKVVYIEPYAKSLAPDLHEDSIAVEVTQPNTNRVLFKPFVGVAPRQYMALFQSVDRKQAGKRVDWNRTQAMPRLFPPLLRYLEWEARESQGVKSAMDSTGLTSTPPGEGN